MVRAGGTYVWGMRGAFVVAALLLFFFQLLPLETAPRGWVAPDLVLALAVVWVARRPDLAPAWLLAGVFLMADLLLQRPPGLWAALALIMTEVLRARADDFRELAFLIEWGIVSAFIAGFYAVYAFVWSITVPFDMTYGLLALQLLLTIASYPILVSLSSMLFGVAKAAPGQTDVQGRKL